MLFILYEGSRQKLFNGFFSVKGWGPPIPLSFLGHNDFPLRGGGMGHPEFLEGKIPQESGILGQITPILGLSCLFAQCILCSV